MTKQATAPASPQTATTVAYIMPRVNIIDQPELVLLEVELPGVPKNGVELEVKDGELTIIGHRALSDGPGDTYITERPRGDYRRVFALSKAIDSGKIDAGINDGVLRVTLHKVERLKPRKISVN